MVGTTRDKSLTLNKAEEMERQLFSEVISILRNHQIPDNVVPMVCVVGVQSHGKSSLTECFVGIPLTLVREDTGTRCPTKFFLQFDETAYTPICSVSKVPSEIEFMYPDVTLTNPKSIKYHDLPGFLGKVMQDCADQGPGGFSEDDCVVNIVSNICPNLYLIDLPGLVSEIDPRHETISRIARKYLAMENCTPLFLVKASEDLATGLLYSFIKKHARSDWKDSSLFLASHFDTKLPKNGEEMLARLEGHCADPENPDQKRVLTKYFVSLNPPPHVDRAKLMESSPEKLVDRIRNLAQLEQTMLDDCLQTIAHSNQPEWAEEYWRKYLGLTQAKQAIKGQFYHAYQGQFEQVRQALETKLKETDTKIELLSEACSNINPMKLRRQISSLVSEYVHTVCQLLDQDQRAWGTETEAALEGQTYEEEVLDCETNGLLRSSWPYEMTSKELAKVSGPSKGWKLEMKCRLIGGAQLRRLFTANRIMLCLSPLPETSPERWMNALAHLPTQDNFPAWDHAVAQVTNWWLRLRLEPSVLFLAARIHRVFARIGENVTDLMQRHQPERYRLFVQDIHGHFINYLTDRVALAKNTAMHLIEAKTKWLNANLSYQVAMMALTNPRCSQLAKVAEMQLSSRFNSKAIAREIEEAQAQATYEMGRIDMRETNVGSRMIAEEKEKSTSETASMSSINSPIPSRGESEAHHHQNNDIDPPSLAKEMIDALTTSRRVTPEERVRALVNSNPFHLGTPRSRFLDHEAIALMQSTAEEHYHAQLGFALHDVESLFISDVEKCVQQSMSTVNNGIGQSLVTCLTEVMFKDDTQLLSTVQVDLAKSAAELKQAKEYRKIVVQDLVRLDSTQKGFQELLNLKNEQR